MSRTRRILTPLLGLSLVALLSGACGTLGGAAIGAGSGAAIGTGVGTAAGTLRDWSH